MRNGHHFLDLNRGFQMKALVKTLIVLHWLLIFYFEGSPWKMYGFLNIS